MPELNAQKAVIIKKPIKMDDLANTLSQKIEEE
jgi:hypothetical protein